MKTFFTVSSNLILVLGFCVMLGGVWGVYFTYQNTVRENIVTPDDASIPKAPVRGPLTLGSQADIIRTHTLKSTGGKTFAEMPRQIEKLDANSKPILGADGKPILVPNTARDLWITATTLTTALNLGIIAYAFSALIIGMGMLMIWLGFLARLVLEK